MTRPDEIVADLTGEGVVYFEHEHTHGNHVDRHAHINGHLHHEHGWHHSPTRPEFDRMYGQRGEVPFRPTPNPPIILGGHDNGQKTPLVVVAYVPELWRPDLRGRLDTLNKAGIGVPYMLYDVSGSPWDYWQMLHDHWEEGEDFVNIEQDVIPPFDFATEFRDCPEPWCGFSYDVFLSDGRTVTMWDYGPRHALALGCVRFRAEMMAEFPDLFYRMGEREWFHLDVGIYQVLDSRYQIHRHYPDAVHLPRMDHDWRGKVMAADPPGAR